MTWSDQSSAGGPTGDRAEPGTVVGGRYALRTPIGHGGMGTVWRANDTLLNRDVAVKVLASHLGEDDRARRRFQREARAAAGLSSHPHVVTIYDVGEHQRRVFMVMEIMRGGSIGDRPARAPPWAPAVHGHHRRFLPPGQSRPRPVALVYSNP